MSAKDVTESRAGGEKDSGARKVALKGSPEVQIPLRRAPASPAADKTIHPRRPLPAVPEKKGSLKSED